MKRLILLLIVIVFSSSLVSCQSTSKTFNITADEVAKQMYKTVSESGENYRGLSFNKFSTYNTKLEGIGECEVRLYEFGDDIDFSILSSVRNGKVYRFVYECTSAIALNDNSREIFDFCSGINIGMFINSDVKTDKKLKEMSDKEKETFMQSVFELTDIKEKLNIENVEKDSYTTAKTKKAVFEYTVKGGKIKFEIYPA